MGAARVFRPAAQHGWVGMAGVLDLGPLPLVPGRRVQRCRSKTSPPSSWAAMATPWLPLTRYSTVAGIPVPDMIAMGWTTQEKMDAIVDRTRSGGGGEIVQLLGNGSAFYAPAESAIAMAKSYLNDKKARPALRGASEREFGVKDMYVGVPVVDRCGRRGEDRRDQPQYRRTENVRSTRSTLVKGLVKACKDIDPSLA